MARWVMFTDSCRYDLPEYNSKDVNKLFGLSFGVLPGIVNGKIEPPVHLNSARFGWYYEKETDTVVLVAYCYENGERNWNEQLEFPIVVRLKIGVPYHCFIYREQGGFRFAVFLDEGPNTWATNTGGYYQSYAKMPPTYGITHSLYFGGTQPAPQDIRVYIGKERP